MSCRLNVLSSYLPCTPPNTRIVMCQVKDKTILYPNANANAILQKKMIRKQQKASN